MPETRAPFGFYQYLPPEYNDQLQERFPLLLFLHGAGERGNGTSELNAVLRNGPPHLIDEGQWPAERPFIVLSPQLDKGRRWSVEDVDAFVTYALRTYRADPARVYLTGLSLGGHGTWTYAAARPDRLAAIAPVAGNGRLITEAGSTYCALAGLPLWAFHGARDDVVDPQGSVVPVEAIRACSEAPARLTVFTETHHDAWSPAYDPARHPAATDPAYDPYDADLYEWLLSQEK